MLEEVSLGIIQFMKIYEKKLKNFKVYILKKLEKQ
jgi:hypothetical protein